MFAILAVDWWSLHAVSDLSHGTPALHDGWIVSPDTATRLAHRHDSDHSLHVMTQLAHSLHLASHAACIRS